MGVERDRTVDELRQAREAYERRDWVVALDRLRGKHHLEAEDALALATAAYLMGDVDEAIRALQGGYQDMISSGNDLGAVRFAFWLALILNVRGETVIGGGWVARGKRLLETQSDDIAERGYLLIHDFYGHLSRGDFASATATAAQVVDAGRRFSQPDLVAQGLMCQGRLMIYAGRVPEGLTILDEAMIGISAREVSPIIAGMVYCAMIEGCQEVSDFTRAASWTSALTRWCDLQPGLVPFTGQCSLHRGQILRLRGAYEEARAEFVRAQQRYQVEGTTAAAALALTEQGDVLRIRGRLDEAESAYRLASELGYEPQPGLVLTWMIRGRTAPAASAIRRLLAEAQTPVHRSRLLPAAVEVMLAAHQPDEARDYCDELSGIAVAFGNSAFRAIAAYAAASVELITDQVQEALGDAREACRLWSDIGSPYEAARARMLIARALRGLGDEDSATAELAVARRAFVDLGAQPGVREVDTVLRRTLPGGLTEREAEVLRLVAQGRTNSDIASVLVLSPKTVERHLSNIFLKLEVSSRTAAAAYAHENGLLA
jgi:ATP/maltotriose-dependent transcriptional regulator MalT